MEKRMMAFVENYDSAFYVFDMKTGEKIYENQTAINFYGSMEKLTDLQSVFPDHEEGQTGLLEVFGRSGFGVLHDQLTLKEDGKPCLVDVSIGYFHQEAQEAYVELRPLFGDVVDMLRNMIDDARKPTVVFYCDQEITVRYCNALARELFDFREGISLGAYLYEADNDTVLGEIYRALGSGKNHHVQLQLRLQGKGQEWYALEFQKHGIGDLGDRLICTLTSVEEHIGTANQLENINAYFNILQSMCKGLLYRYDIKTRTLYRNESTAKAYGVPEVAENYPDEAWLREMLHPEDVEGYAEFFRRVASGIDSEHSSRMLSKSGIYEHHKFTYKGVKTSSGEILEMIGSAMNIHNLTETQKELANINEYFNILQSLSRDLLYRLDIKTRTLYRNADAAKFYGLPAEVHGYPNLEQLKTVLHEDDVEEYVAFIEEVIKGVEGHHTARLVSPSGEYEYHKFIFKQLCNPDGSLKEMVGKAMNVQDLMDLENKANYDLLTNTLNKISFQEQVTGILRHSSLQSHHALFFIDLDDFKGINDNLGHSFGDFLLRTVGQRLKKMVRGQDLVGRVGGDEFVVFLESCGDVIQLQQRGEQILTSLRREFLKDGVSAVIRASIGIAMFPDHGVTYEDLYENADKALYHSKDLGKDVATIFRIR